LAALAALTTSAVLAEPPAPCGRLVGSAAGSPVAARLPQFVEAYLRERGNRPFEQSQACGAWALGADVTRRRVSSTNEQRSSPARFIVFPARGVGRDHLTAALPRGTVRAMRSGAAIVDLGAGLNAARVYESLAHPAIEYAEPDCDGPDFATTTATPAITQTGGSAANCWNQGAARVFPNDPCLSELWGHNVIGWSAAIAARSRPKVVAVLDSGVDITHEDLAGAVAVSRVRASNPFEYPELGLDAGCRGRAGCYPHGTQMAGTIAGRMNNGVGVVGVAPHSRVLPLLITQVEHGNLLRLSSIASAIDAAGASPASIINISAKWPVDSRLVRESIERATGASDAPRKLLVTGYTTSFAWDDSVTEGYPSRYRCMAGVIAAVPGDGRGETPQTTARQPGIPQDGRIMAPGVDIVVTTTQNASSRYALAQAGGASSAAAYTSGALALIWGTPPLDRCGAREIKQLLFCRSKRTRESNYPWLQVDFLAELARLPGDASCSDALAALGCN
jgi:hypothetical protein